MTDRIQTQHEIDTIALAVFAFSMLEPIQALSEPHKAFDNCHTISNDFITFLKSYGLKSTLVQLATPTIEYPNAYFLWHELPTSIWSHYVVQVEGVLIYDWTARQFNPESDHPEIYTPENIHRLWKTVHFNPSLE